MSAKNTVILNLDDISFGKTDAFNELSELGPEYFLDSFVVCEKYRLSDFLDGKKFYICGKKGTGKTAFLRYLECQLRNDPEQLVIPIRFKSEFDETDKAQLMKLATADSEESGDSSPESGFNTSANRMWNELSEELILSYSADDIKAIKTFLNRIELPFTYDYLVSRAEQLSVIYPNVKSFFEKVSMADFLEKMFSLGVIGNTGKRMVFCFHGDQDISLVDPMVIHNPLRNFFAVQSQKVEHS